MKIQMIILFLPLLIGANEKIKKAELTGKHWAGNCNDMTCDTMNYEAFKKYDPKRYQWGGYAEGIEFHEDGSAQEYQNIMCSDESNPISSFPSKWKWQGKDTLIVEGYYAITKYKVLALSNKILKMNVLDLKTKEIK